MEKTFSSISHPIPCRTVSRETLIDADKWMKGKALMRDLYYRLARIGDVRKGDTLPDHLREDVGLPPSQKKVHVHVHHWQL